jgi:hypothetical protein
LVADSQAMHGFSSPFCRLPHLTYPCVAVVYDLNGREAGEAGIILDALPSLEQYIFCSSAGVYKKSDEMPHREVDAGDPKSRHKVPLQQR